MKSFKVKVKTPKISNKVQKHLFMVGCRWVDDSVATQYLNEPYLYILDNKITFTLSEELFKRNPLPRLKPKDVLAMRPLNRKEEPK